MISVISLSEFRKYCPQLFNAVATKGVSFFVTKRGLKVAKVVPIPPPKKGSKSKYGCMADTASVVKNFDLLAPIDVDWDANI